MKEFDINNLSPEQLAAITRQIEEKQKNEKLRKLQLQNDYDALREVQVRETFTKLQNVSNSLEKEKTDVFSQFGSLLKMKQELYRMTDKQMELQQSHTFTTSDSAISIIIGSNLIDRWGDDVNVGIERVNAWIESKITDNDSRAFIRALMKPNSQGTLKANRVLDLAKEADRIGDNELIEAVNFIRDQYRPVKTSTYVKAKYVDEMGCTQWLALSMSAV